ncbi:hypothetical protein F383_28377 [Gossypium arboreum]|uniref:Uncharacterized protein n=1 Tax=Gossypium arboreum TaxID=29729 RepID=A0A0B0P8F9_GOSAR|nr:hypothetical protein F383_28377 [Gossypium arboreum]
MPLIVRETGLILLLQIITCLSMVLRTIMIKFSTMSLVLDFFLLVPPWRQILKRPSCLMLQMVMRMMVIFYSMATLQDFNFLKILLQRQFGNLLHKTPQLKQSITWPFMSSFFYHIIVIVLPPMFLLLLQLFMLNMCIDLSKV